MNIEEIFDQLKYLEQEENEINFDDFIHSFKIDYY